jgi:predicted metalloprotease with PDZ domain
VRVSFLKCKRSLEAVGAEVTSQLEAIPPSGMAAKVVQVQLGETWRGQTEDLSPLVEATYHQHFRLVGTRVDDAAVKLFEAKQDLAWLQLINTSVTVAAVDSLKARRPNANVYVRNQALLGLAARSRGAGVGVEMVQPGSSAAAAGIKEGDVLLALDGHALPDFDRMTAHIAQHKPGDKIQLDIQRGNEKLKVEATLGSWPEQPR